MPDSKDFPIITKILATLLQSFIFIFLCFFIRVLVAKVPVLRAALVKLDTPAKVTVASVRQDSQDRAAVKVIGAIVLCLISADSLFLLLSPFDMITRHSSDTIKFVLIRPKRREHIHYVLLPLH